MLRKKPENTKRCWGFLNFRFVFKIWLYNFHVYKVACISNGGSPVILKCMQNLSQGRVDGRCTQSAILRIVEEVNLCNVGGGDASRCVQCFLIYIQSKSPDLYVSALVNL